MSVIKLLIIAMKEGATASTIDARLAEGINMIWDEGSSPSLILSQR